MVWLLGIKATRRVDWFNHVVRYLSIIDPFEWLICFLKSVSVWVDFLSLFRRSSGDLILKQWVVFFLECSIIGNPSKFWCQAPADNLRLNFLAFKEFVLRINLRHLHNSMTHVFLYHSRPTLQNDFFIILWLMIHHLLKRKFRKIINLWLQRQNLQIWSILRI